MHVKALFVLVVLGVLGASRPGHAEKVKTNQETKVYSREGEQSPVVVKVKSGQMMTVLAKDGRWIKVRVSGRTGWVPRTKVDMPEGDDEMVRNTRRRPFVDGRGTKRGFGGETGPDDRIGADATGAGDDSDSGDSKGSDSKGSDSKASDSKASKSGKPAKGDDDDDSAGRGKKQAAAAKPDKARPDKAKPDKPAGKPDKAKASEDEDEDVVHVDDDDDDDKPSGASDSSGAGGGDSGDGGGEKQPARPMAHVAKKVSAHEKPDPDSEEAFTAGTDMALYVGRTNGEWTRVSTEDGDAGWILTAKLDIEQPAGGGEGGPRTRLLDARAGLGVNFISQSLATHGGAATFPDNYSTGGASATLALGGAAVYPYSTRYWIGGEASLDYNKAISGISFMNTTTGFTYYTLNLRAEAGYDLQKANGMVVFARLGLHYDSFQVDDFADFTKNPGKVPNQIIWAPTVGAALAIPRLTPKLGLTINLDTFIFGSSVSQTVNLEDGTGPSAKAVFLGGHLVYRWKPNMDIQAGYDLSYTSVSFSGMAPASSKRGHTGDAPSSGSDVTNAVAVGVVYGF